MILPANINLNEVTKNSVSTVFDTMLSMKIQPMESAKVNFPAGERILGTIGFAGDSIMGVLHIQMTELFGRTAAANMLGMKPEEITDSAQVNDVIGELSNMIGGDFKNNIGDIGLSCKLTLPSISRGENIHTEKSDAETQFSSVGFSYDTHNLLIEVHLKSPKQ